MKRIKKRIVINLERKILIFLDQPHAELLQRLRPLLSHDGKEIQLKITDKTQKAGMRTKNVYLRGYPSVIFCTAGLKIDEQEATRFLLLSPETNQTKLKEGIYEKLKRETDSKEYESWLEDNPERKLLKDRVMAIKQENITEIIIGNPEKVKELFFKNRKVLKPRHQRDIGRITSLIKVFALLNLWFRERQDSTIIANEEDIEEAFRVWYAISESQEHNLPPFVYSVFQEVIVPAYKDFRHGLTRKDIMQEYFEVYGRPLQGWMLRQEIIPMLENAGLIIQEADTEDKRKMLVYPNVSLTADKDGNSERHGGGK